MCQPDVVTFRTLASLLVALASAGVGYAAAISRYSAFNRAALAGSHGRLEAGEKFGIAIGDDYEAVEAKFTELGFERRELTKPQSCHGFTYAADLTPHLWFDNSWRKGTVCVVSSAGRVIYLSWTYGLGFP